MGRERATTGRDRIERFERVFAANSRAVFAYAARRAPERADDVVAETFAVVWRRLDELPVDARPWLYGIARRVLAGQWRSQNRQHALVSRLIELDPPTRTVVVDAAEHDELYRALGQLGELDREALLLVYWEGLEPHEAATALEISRDALNQRIHRARERLRALCLEGRPIR